MAKRRADLKVGLSMTEMEPPTFRSADGLLRTQRDDGIDARGAAGGND